MKRMLRMSMDLSAESFCQNYRSFLLRNTAPYIKNDDGTFNRKQRKYFFINLTEAAKARERNLANDLKSKIQINYFLTRDKSHTCKK